jgi:hypothetical protein
MFAFAVLGALCVIPKASAEETEAELRAQWRGAFDKAAAAYQLSREPDEVELRTCFEIHFLV